MTHKFLPLDWLKRRSGKEMSAKAELVLNTIFAQNKPMNIMEIVTIAQNLGIGSMVSCHSALEWLSANGYVKVTQSDKDKRHKKVELTSKGKGYFG